MSESSGDGDDLKIERSSFIDLNVSGISSNDEETASESESESRESNVDELNEKHELNINDNLNNNHGMDNNYVFLGVLIK